MKPVSILSRLTGCAALILTAGCSLFTTAPELSNELKLPGSKAVFPQPGVFELHRDQQILRFAAGSRIMRYNGIKVILPESPEFNKAQNRYSLSESTVKTTVLPLQTPERLAPANVQTVMIDPGHGGSDPGARYALLPEKELNLKVASCLKNELIKRGFRVIMSRSGDSYLTLDRRVRMAEECKADILVSIHHNAAKNKMAAGYEIYAPPPQRKNAAPSLQLAAAIHRRTIDRLPVIDRGVKTANFKVLRVNIPAVLIEAGFLSNPAEEKAANSPARQLAAATAIAGGIADFASRNTTGSQQERAK